MIFWGLRNTDTLTFASTPYIGWHKKSSPNNRQKVGKENKEFVKYSLAYH